MDYVGYFSDSDIVQDITNYNCGLPKDTNGLTTSHGLYQVRPEQTFWFSDWFQLTNMCSLPLIFSISGAIVMKRGSWDIGKAAYLV